MEYAVTNRIFFKNREEAEEFVKTIGGFICSDCYFTYFEENYYGANYVRGKTLVLLRAEKYFMKSLENFGIKKKKVNNKTVYEKT